MSIIEVQDEITALLRTIPNAEFYEGHTSDQALLELIASVDKLRPFGTISFGLFVDPARSVNGIVGARYDSRETSFVTRAIANTDRDARRLASLIDGKVLGYVPTNCGEIRPSLFGGVGEINSLGNPTRFAAVQSYRFLFNSDLTK